jgi:hypothetical protein
MKTLILVAFAIAMPAFGQGKPVAAPEKPAAGQETAKETAKPKPVARKHGPKRGEDARHCLEKTSTTEVIKCAEEYL